MLLLEPGCDEGKLLGANGLQFGRYLSMHQGAFFRFVCDSGYNLIGKNCFDSLL